ncbi:tetraspanin-3-like isoform X2 [Ambystoma mexicanum]|uniref:tetraspanin-3-like isoform X2 n=1 Tax=Ambystoma mexicanum TaxID=8296 RepID=UPI0037E73333
MKLKAERAVRVGSRQCLTPAGSLSALIWPREAPHRGLAMGDQLGGGCLCVLKLVSLLFLGCGGFMAFAGVSLILIYLKYHYFFQDYFIALPAMLAIGAAAFLIITSLVGLCMPRKDARCQQATFMYFIVVVFCLEATAGVLGFLYSSRIEYELGSMENIFGRYNGTSSDLGSRAVDTLQKQLGCCGVYNYTDWEDHSWQPHTFNESVPESCCLRSYSNCTGDESQPEYLYQKMLAALIDCVLMGRQSLQDYRILDSETFA